MSHLLLLEQDFSPPGALLFSFTRKLSKVLVFGWYLGRFTDDSGGTYIEEKVVKKMSGARGQLFKLSVNYGREGRISTASPLTSLWLSL